jgi:large subunit ribosomal protein L14e
VHEANNKGKNKVRKGVRMIEIGRLCVKLAGREAGKKCVIVEVIDNKFVIIDGDVRRKKCNIKHLEPLDQTIKITKGTPHDTVIKEMGLKEKKKKAKEKPKSEKPAKQRKTKNAAEPVKPERKEKKEKKPKKEKAKKEKNIENKEQKQ